MHYLMEKITESPKGAIHLLKAPSLIYLIALQEVNHMVSLLF